MNLVESIITIQYDNSWGIWADIPFSPDSEARFGQVIFEKGGLLDDKVFYADGVQVGNWFTAYFEDYPEMLEDQMEVELGAEQMICEWEEARQRGALHVTEYYGPQDWKPAE